MRKVLAALAVVFLAAHLPSLPPSLEDLDSVNFALGVRDFDLAEHQPHPPGYPVFIALAKLSTAALRIAGVPSPEARGLALWSAVAGATLVLLVPAFFGALDGDETRAALSAAVLASAPLFWFTALRPLSDMAGLAAAFAALTALALAISAGARDSDRGRWLTAGAFAAGVAIGIRSQTFFLTAPLLAWAISWPRNGLSAATRRQAGLAFAAGVLLWAIPLVIVTGGPRAYVHALRSQGAEDFSGVVMVWTHRTARIAAYALLNTFVVPWRSWVLGTIATGLAAVGVLVLLRRSPRVVALLALAFGPYAVFHLLFQETVTVRYALPLMAPTAYLAVTALFSIHRVAAVVGVATLAAAGLALSVPAGILYGRQAAPVFRMFSDMQTAAPAPVAIGMHRAVFTETRRARLWAGTMRAELLPAPSDYEWLELTRVLRAAPDATAWFVADPRRTDLALIDAHSVRAYRWSFDAATFVGGTRPSDLSWLIYSRPGWFLEQGWALTPEIAGIAHRDGWGPHLRPSVGWLRRRTEPAQLLFGGRHLGGPSASPVVVTARLDNRELLRITVGPGFFLHTPALPAGALDGDGPLGRLTVTAALAGPGDAVPPVAIEQFNLQPPDRVMFAYAEGWHEPEYNLVSRRSWRWMSDKSVLWIHSGGRNVTLCLEGESPRKYYDVSPAIRISSGVQELARFSPTDDFTECVLVPSSGLEMNDGRVTIDTNLTHVPADREGVADRRRLGLRIYSVTVAQLEGPARSSSLKTPAR